MQTTLKFLIKKRRTVNNDKDFSGILKTKNNKLYNNIKTLKKVSGVKKIKDETVKKYKCIKLPKFRVISKNVYRVPRPHKLHHSDIDECNCKYDSKTKQDDENGNCGEDCLNRALKTECTKNICNVGEMCRNQRFQNNEYADIVPFLTPNRGWGLKTKKSIKTGGFIIEYTGEIIDEDTCYQRLLKDYQNKSKNFYYLSLSNDLFIDASSLGNLGRFLNHSCMPNCYIEKWSIGSEIRAGIFAKQNIEENEELTIDYQFECSPEFRQECFCGTKLCTGYIGLKKRKYL